MRVCNVVFLNSRAEPSKIEAMVSCRLVHSHQPHPPFSKVDQPSVNSKYGLSEKRAIASVTSSKSNAVGSASAIEKRSARMSAKMLRISFIWSGVGVSSKMQS